MTMIALDFFSRAGYFREKKFQRGNQLVQQKKFTKKGGNNIF